MLQLASLVSASPSESPVPIVTANHPTHSPDFLEGALCTHLEPLVWFNFLYYKKRKNKERLRYLHKAI